GRAASGHIDIDTDAAGYGWYVDNNPTDNAEFGNALGVTRLQTDPNQLPAGRIDLFTTVMHELGHQLRLDDSYASADRDSLMYGYLVTGERRLPAAGQADGATPGAIDHEEFAIGPITVADLTHALPFGKAVAVSWQATVDTQTNKLITNPSSAATV